MNAFILLTADAAANGQMGGWGFTYIISIVLMLGIFYFLMIKPQKKEQKRVEAMLADMEVGDVVVTTGGFYGVLIDITEDDVIVEFGSDEHCRIPMRKSAISQVEKAEK